MISYLLFRSQKLKKMSVLDSGGGVKWVYREVTCLLCPAAKPKSVTYEKKAAMFPSESVGTNKKLPAHLQIG